MPETHHTFFICNGTWRALFTPCILVAFAALVIAASGSSAADVLRYERGAVLQGELWRLLTGNLVHLGLSHLALNLAGLVLVCGLFHKSLTARQWLVVLFICALTTTLGLLVFSPQVAWYVGLSGVLHGLFVAGTLAQLQRGQRCAYVCVVLIGVKLAVELVWGPSPELSSLIHGGVIVVAHFYGAIGGLVGHGILQRINLNKH